MPDSSLVINNCKHQFELVRYDGQMFRLVPDFIQDRHKGEFRVYAQCKLCRAHICQKVPDQLIEMIIRGAKITIESNRIILEEKE